MKRFTLSAQSVFGVLGLVCLLQSASHAQIGVGVREGNFDRPGAFLFGDEGLPGPREFMTSPEIRAFGPNGEGEGPSAPFYDQPSYNYTGWYRPRASGRDQAARCYGDTFRPRGYGHMFARPWNGQRMDYKPYVLEDWRSPHGPAYYNYAEDQRCPQCDHQGNCLANGLHALHDKKCQLLGNCPIVGCGSCGRCGASDCDECGSGTCDTCDEGSIFGGRTRRGWSEWITRPRRRVAGRRPGRLRNRGDNQCDGNCGQSQCQECNGGCSSCAAASGELMLGAPAGNSCGCTSCQNRAPQLPPLNPVTQTNPEPFRSVGSGYEPSRTTDRSARVFDNGAGVVN